MYIVILIVLFSQIFASDAFLTKTNKLNMEKLSVFRFILIMSLVFNVNFLLAQNSISGTIVDTEDGVAIPGASVFILGTTNGSATDFDGNFTITTSRDLPIKIEVSSLGYTSQIIDVTSADQNLSIQLELGSDFLDEVIISASRRPEKIVDAPASVSVISARKIANSSEAIDPIRHLMNVPGVTVANYTANSMNIEMRSGNGLLGTAVLPLLDYRVISTPAARSNFSYQYGLSNLDLERIEVIRGTNSALYGPGVEGGVVHFITKKAIDHPGTSAELYTGNLSSRGGAVRHAYANKSKTFGYKLNVKYNEGNDFGLDLVEDAGRISTFYTTISHPAIKNKVVDATQSGTPLLTMSDLDTNNDGNPLASEYQNLAMNAHFEFRPNENTTATFSGGFSDAGGIGIQDLGYFYNQGLDYWAHARATSGNLFAQVSYNSNDGGDIDNPSFLYETGNRVVGKREFLVANVQYDLDVPSFLDSKFNFGIDYQDTKSDSEYTLYGRNDDNDPYSITGAYAQGQSKLADNLIMTYAARIDKYNFIDEAAFAPKLAFVYKLNESNSIRASYSVGTYGASSLEAYVDFPVAELKKGVADVWLSGQIEPHIFDQNAGIEITGAQAYVDGGYYVPRSETSLKYSHLYEIAKGLTLPEVYGQLGANAALAPLVAPIQSFFSTYAGPAGSTGQIRGFNLFNPSETMSQLTDVSAAQIATINNYEIGYKGKIGKKLSLGIDFYYAERKGFTEFTGVGPLYQLIEGDLISTWPATVGQDLASDPGMAAAAAGYVQAAYAGAGLPATGLPAATSIALGLPSSGLALLLAPDGALPPSNLATLGLLKVIGDRVAGGFTTAAGLLNGEINMDGVGMVSSNRAPNDGLNHVSAGYRQYPNATRSHWGADVSAEYYYNENISLWANYSYISQNAWIPGEADDDDLPFPSYLNTPLNKCRAGLRFNYDNVRASLAYQYDEAFFSNFGAGLGGDAPERHTFDGNIGFQIMDGLFFDIQATNLLDREYRQYPGLPIIGRRVLFKTTFNF